LCDFVKTITLMHVDLTSCACGYVADYLFF